MAVLEEVKQGVLKSSVAVLVIAMQDTKHIPSQWHEIQLIQFWEDSVL